ncbi:MAG: hypothetical protein JNK74_10700 [Candidatus Hydrogenedentes bacterium]|nr:hypothetical protein [Candidatus Hydrogenedentota bacterium]
MILNTRWCATTTIAVWGCLSLSCAHTPDAHVHLSAPAPPFDKPLIIRGSVADSNTGEPIPYADVYVFDARHENWTALQQHNAHVGTANRAGVIDLAAMLKTADTTAFKSEFRSGFGGWNATRPLLEAAEARCRAGEPPVTMVVLAAPRYQDAIVFPEAPMQLDESRGANILQLGTVTMVRRPDSDFIFAESWLETQEADAR